MATLPANLKITKDQSEQLRASLAVLMDREVLVGFPEETSDRQSDELTAQGQQITNAALGYIHDNGAPEANIPQREFMRPAIDGIRDKITKRLAGMARKAVVFFAGAEEATKGFERLGLEAELAIKNKINEGIPPPLSDRTLRERANRGTKGRQGALWELAWREAGADPGTELAKPLIDTAQMRNAVKYVIRSRRKR